MQLAGSPLNKGFPLFSFIINPRFSRTTMDHFIKLGFNHLIMFQE